MYGSFSINHILKLILITNYSKICAIVTLKWVNEDQELYDQSLLIFTMPAQYEAYRGNDGPLATPIKSPCVSWAPVGISISNIPLIGIS